eukprot:TRINITY_DN6350_c0_g1_i3.p1 TRINITY_DN6350_c0_g1~~TRINITY_DN6350_c0_g1_i3.p1  ORF type:complete len:155 (-),score=28.97 TRINITY_DN6350_c0_g1_i3:156-620(-)
MVLKTTLCRFSGLRIYPGRGMLYVRTDGQQYLLLSRKAKSLFSQRKRGAKIAWCAAYRRAHKKDQSAEISRKKRRTAQAKKVRSIAGTSLEVINKKKNEKPETRQAARDAALREVKERMKKAKADKSKATKGGAAKMQKGAVKNVPRGGPKPMR